MGRCIHRSTKEGPRSHPVRARTIILASFLIAVSGALPTPVGAQSSVKKYEAQEIQRREQLRRQREAYEQSEIQRREQARRQQGAKEAAKRAATEAEAQRMRERDAYIKKEYGDIIERFRTFSSQLIVKCSETSVQLYLGDSSVTGKLYQVNSRNQITSETSIYIKEFEQNYDPINIANRGVVEKLTLVSFNEISGGETYTDGDYVSSFSRSNPHPIEGARIQIEVRPKYSDDDKEFFVSLFRLQIGHPSMGSGNGEPFRQMPVARYQQDPSSFDTNVSDEIENFVRTGESNLPIAKQYCVDQNSLRTVNKYRIPEKSKVIYGWSVKEFEEAGDYGDFPPSYRREPNLPPVAINDRSTSIGYPSRALQQELQGIVEFELLITADGRVENCTISRSSGSILLDAETCKAVKNTYRYIPATNDQGRPAAAYTTGRINWRLPK